MKEKLKDKRIDYSKSKIKDSLFRYSNLKVDNEEVDHIIIWGDAIRLKITVIDISDKFMIIKNSKIISLVVYTHGAQESVNTTDQFSFPLSFIDSMEVNIDEKGNVFLEIFRKDGLVINTVSISSDSLDEFNFLIDHINNVIKGKK